MLSFNLHHGWLFFQLQLLFMLPLLPESCEEKPRAVGALLTLTLTSPGALWFQVPVRHLPPPPLAVSQEERFKGTAS